MAPSVWLLFLLLPCCFALYADQAGQYDWHRENIGEVKTAVFHSNIQQRTVFVASDFAVAALHSRSGKIIWRQVLPEGESMNRLFFAGKVVYSVSYSSSHLWLRAWLAADGSLLWDSSSTSTASSSSSSTSSFLSWSLKQQLHNMAPLSEDRMLSSSESYVAAMVSDVNDDDVNEVAIVAQNQVVVRNGVTGAVMWSATLSPEALGVASVDLVSVAFSVTTNQIRVLARSPVSLFLVSLNVHDGSMVNHLTFNSALSQDFLLLPDGEVVMVKDDTLTILPTQKKATALSFSLQSLVSSASAQLSAASKSPSQSQRWSLREISHSSLVAPRVSGNCFVAATSSSSLALCLKADGALQSMFHAAMAGVAYTALSGLTGDWVLLATYPHMDRLHVQVRKVETGLMESEFSSISSYPTSQHGLLANSWVEGYKKSNGQMAYRLLLSAQDHSLTMLQEEKVLWQREEALAEITQAEWFKIPSKSATTQDLEFPSFTERLQLQANSLQETLNSWIKKLSGASQASGLNGNFPTNETDGSGLQSDYFGFVQILVCVTRPGKVFALHSLSSRILWSFLLPSFGKSVNELFVIQHPSASTPLASILTKAPNSHSLLYFNYVTGSITQTISLPFMVREAHRLPQHDKHGQHVLLLVDTKLQVHAYPESEEAFALVRQHINDLALYRVDLASNSILGFALAQKTDNHGHETSLILQPTWTVTFKSPNEIISDVAAQPHNVPTHSSVRSLGGFGSDNLIHKYLNPHLLAVATIAAPHSGWRPLSHSDRNKISEPAVIIYVIDVLRGQIKFKYVQSGCVGPVSLLHFENLVIAHYFSQRSTQYEMSVMELYDSQPPSMSLSFTSLFKAVSGWSGHDHESWWLDDTQPQTMHQSYVFRTAVKRLGVTQTRHGITNKMLLMALSSGQVLSMDRGWFDPRRVSNPTPEQREEGAIPFSPNLPFNPTDIITYNHTVAGVTAFSTGSTNLESGCLVLAYGLDQFFIMVQPSLGFDVLNSDFNYLFLITTVVALAVATLVSRHKAKQKALLQAWK